MAYGIDTIIAMLRTADPKQNAPYTERHNALNLAQKLMSNMKIDDVAILNNSEFKMDDLYRIYNQFSVGNPIPNNAHSGKGHATQQGSTDASESWWTKFKREHSANQTTSYGNVTAATVQASGSSTEYKTECDYQGSVPNWDGYNGE